MLFDLVPHCTMARIDRRNAWSLKFVNVDQNCPQPEVTLVSRLGRTSMRSKPLSSLTDLARLPLRWLVTAPG